MDALLNHPLVVRLHVLISEVEELTKQNVRILLWLPPPARQDFTPPAMREVEQKLVLYREVYRLCKDILPASREKDELLDLCTRNVQSLDFMTVLNARL